MTNNWEKWDKDHRPKSADKVARQAGSDWVSRETKSLTDLHPGLRLNVSRSSSGHLVLHQIVVPKDERQSGVGGHVMRHLTAHADAHGDTMALTPSKDYGGSVARLKTFYKRHGFKPNSGSSRDYSTSESMIREPKK